MMKAATSSRVDIAAANRADIASMSNHADGANNYTSDTNN